MNSSLAGFPVYLLISYFFIYGFMGWVMETTLFSINEKKFVNRGFLNGPICPVYGVGMILIILFLFPLRDNLILLFFVGGLVATLLEFFTGWLLETLFHARWWDYSHKRFNLKGYITLSNSLAWCLLCVLMIHVVEPVINRLIHKVPDSLVNPILYGLMIVFLIDCVGSVMAAISLRKTLIKIKNMKKEVTHAIENTPLYRKNREKLQAMASKYEGVSNEIKLKLAEAGLKKPGQTYYSMKKLEEKKAILWNRLGYFQNRLVKSFPNIKSIEFGAALEELKEKLNHKKGENRKS